jgi:predicted Rossmann fold flavoprotein
MHYDTIIIGAGAAGLMAAIEAGKRGKKVALIEHTNSIGEKIRISGGGRCNFTNLGVHHSKYISENPHFVKSALSQYTQHDFISLVEEHKIKYHEKTLGQLFCDDSSRQIINMLVALCEQNNVRIIKNCSVQDISKSDQFIITTTAAQYESDTIIIATGGLSIPKMGATDFGYRIAKKFGLKIIQTRPALVPLIASKEYANMCVSLAGVSNMSITKFDGTEFKESILFTHKGLSGPAVLQISSYMKSFKDQVLHINLLPDVDLKELFMENKNSKQTVSNYLKNLLPNRLVDNIATSPVYSKALVDNKKDALMELADILHNFPVGIDGSEGFLKAEVTAGGLSTDELSSKTMECKKVPGLFFIGEVVDVTGWLGGYNFQWAWSSGFVAGNNC